MRLRGTWDFSGLLAEFNKSEFWKLKFYKNLRNYFIWEDYKSKYVITFFSKRNTLPLKSSEHLKQRAWTGSTSPSAKLATVSCSEKSSEKQFFFFFFFCFGGIKFSYHTFQDTHFQEFWPVWNMLCSWSDKGKSFSPFLGCWLALLLWETSCMLQRAGENISWFIPGHWEDPYSPLFPL